MTLLAHCYSSFGRMVRSDALMWPALSHFVAWFNWNQTGVNRFAYLCQCVCVRVASYESLSWFCCGILAACCCKVTITHHSSGLSGGVAPPPSHLHTEVTTGDLAPLDLYLPTWGRDCEAVKLSAVQRGSRNTPHKTLCVPSQMPETWLAWHVRNTAICSLITSSSRIVILPESR